MNFFLLLFTIKKKYSLLIILFHKIEALKMLIQFALKRNLISFLCICLLFLTNDKIANADNTCTTLKVEYPVNPLSQWPNLNPAIIVYTSRIILSFKCTQGDNPNPTIPINYGNEFT